MKKICSLKVVLFPMLVIIGHVLYAQESPVAAGKEQSPAKEVDPVMAMVYATMKPGWKPTAEDGWISLFNGKDLDQWKIPEGDNGHWKVVDKAIDYDARSESLAQDKNLWTKESFSDFILRISWRMKPGLVPEFSVPVVLPSGDYEKDENGNDKKVTIQDSCVSGVYLRGAKKGEVNMWNWPVGSGELWTYRFTKTYPPEVRAAATPKLRADKPTGNWNTFTILAKGNNVTVFLNGKRVIDNAFLPDLPESGPLALQHHGGFDETANAYKPSSSCFQYRDIWIKKLDEKK